VTIRYLSVCSGIEAASVAWEPLGWAPVAFAEIDAFPSAVLKHRFPHVPNLGDFTKIKKADVGPIDLLVGGTPCQSFSVAGLRGGLADDRGNLALEFLRLADRTRPRWLVWENVPGVLSSNGGRDFGAILGGVVELGYGFAYRVLDAQYFGVPQRRRRVFVVGYLGDWRPAAAVLFERHCLQRHSPPRREKRKGIAHDVAPCLGASGRGFSRVGETRGQDPVIVASTGDISHCLNAGGMGRIDYETETLIAHSLRAEGFDASEDGAGRGTPIVPVILKAEPNHADAKETRPREILRALRQAVGEETFAKWGLGVIAAFQKAQVLRSEMHGGFIRRAPDKGHKLDDDALPRKEDGASWTVQRLWEAGCAGRAPRRWRPSQQLTRELGTYLSELSQQGASPEGFVHGLWRASEGIGVLREALSALQEIRRPYAEQGQPAYPHMQVRRLTPREAERLQGFPDDWTLVPYRGKPAADGPRYKAIGNSMAVPVMRWIGERIATVESLIGGSRD